MIKNEIDTQTPGHKTRTARLDRIEKLEKQIVKLDTLKWEMSEFIFQAVSLIVGLVAIIFAFLIGVPTYQKISDTTNTELIREVRTLNYILIFLIGLLILNIGFQFYKWKHGRIDGRT